MTFAPSLLQRHFEPASQLWQVNREMALLLAGGRALLMQLAHPKVAAGVAAHSDFEKDPLGRLHRTMGSMWAIIFDEFDHAGAVLQRIEAVHRRVQGTVPGSGAGAGDSYRALDQDLLLWVHATLIDSALAAYDLFVAPLTKIERQNYYIDSQKLASLFRIDETMIPETLESFQQYLSTTLQSGEVLPSTTAKRLARSILYPRPWMLRPAGPLFRLLTAGLLPESLRRNYELQWDAGREARYRRAAKAIRILRPLIPRPLRLVPNARRAEKKIRRTVRSS
ncbi:MAG TPA: oxygenase MpaB family protein [Candidatus Binatia bacterium]|nr:oxygenase MpaB family protein [Candidatus Binatia bacterium]